jgi:putative transposase
VYPYLLQDLDIDRANQVWCTDITYIPMRKGFLYLVAIMDWHSRKVLSWRLSNSLDTAPASTRWKRLWPIMARLTFSIATRAVNLPAKDLPTCLKITKLKSAWMAPTVGALDEGRWMDNVFIERLWRSLKYEEVYLKAYDTVAQAQQSIGEWMAFYNQDRRHASLSRMTPDQVYYDLPSGLPLAA